MADGTPESAHEAPKEYRAPALLFTRRLGFRLCLLVLVAVAPLFAFAARAAMDSRDDAIRAAGSQAERLAEVAAYSQQVVLEQALRVLEAAAATPPVTRGDAAERTVFLKEMLARNPGYLDFHLVAADGSIVASASPEGTAKEYADPRVADRALKTGQPAVGDFEKRANGQPTVYLARPAGEGLVLGACLTMGWLERYHATLRLPDGSVLDVLDPKGLNLVRLPKSSVGDTGQIHPAPHLLAVRSDALPVVGEDTDGVRRYFGVAPLLVQGTNRGFQVVIGIPETAVIGPAQRAMTIHLVVSAMVLVISLALAQVMAEQFVLKRVNGLILATKRLASTDLSGLRARQRVCQDPSELGDLERSFDDMARALEKRARELDEKARGLER
jgi:hypothetical protein